MENKSLRNNETMPQAEYTELNHLMSMGFNADLANLALLNSNGNLNLAIEIILSRTLNSNEQPTQNTENSPIMHDSIHSNRRRQLEEAAMQRKNSDHLNQHLTARSNASMGNHSSTISISETIDRNNNYMGLNRPTKQQPYQLDKINRSFQQKLEVLSGELARFPTTVDLLIYILAAILNNPKVQKYREVKTTNSKFKSVIRAHQNDHGVDLLLLCGFEYVGEWLTLRGLKEDSSHLWLAKVTLENTQKSEIYKSAKDRAEFQKILQESVNSANSEENSRRQLFEVKVPTEPALGEAGTARITIFIADDVVQRRFRSDDILADVLNWLSATYSSTIHDRLKTRFLELVDKTVYPKRLMIIDENYDRTLQSIGMWPSAELLIQSAGTLEIDTKNREKDANAK